MACPDPLCHPAGNWLLLKNNALTAPPTAATEKEFPDFDGIRRSSAITRGFATITGERYKRRRPLAELQINQLPSVHPPDPTHASIESAAFSSVGKPRTHYMATDAKTVVSKARCATTIGYEEDDSIDGGVPLNEETPIDESTAFDGNAEAGSSPFKDEWIECAPIKHGTSSRSSKLLPSAMTGSETEQFNFESLTIDRDPRRNGVDFSTMIGSGDYDFLRTTTETSGSTDDKGAEVTRNFSKPVPRRNCLPISPEIVVTNSPPSLPLGDNPLLSNRGAAKASEPNTDSLRNKESLSVHSHHPALSPKPDTLNVYVDAHGQHLPVFPTEKQHSEVKSNHSVRSKLTDIKQRARLQSQSVVYPMKMVSKYVFYRAVDGVKAAFRDGGDNTEATQLAPTNPIEKPKRSMRKRMTMLFKADADANASGDVRPTGVDLRSPQGNESSLTNLDFGDDKPQGVVHPRSPQDVTANSSAKHVPTTHRLSIFSGDENRPFGVIFNEAMEDLRKVQQDALKSNIETVKISV